MVDPRTEDGELLFEERFPLSFVADIKRQMGAYQVAGLDTASKYPDHPRAGRSFNVDGGRGWEEEQYPELDYILASLDTAYGEKQENDFSALTIWGIFSVDSKAFNAPTRTLSRYGTEQQIERVYAEGAPNVVLMHAWRARIPFHELVQKTLKSCRQFKVDKILIEDKAAGLSVIQELRRVSFADEFGIHAITPKGDKWMRLNSVSHLWQEGMIWAPAAPGEEFKEWAELVIRECEVFPKGKHDDLVDTASMAAKFLRDNGFLTRAPERLQEIEDSKVYLGRHVSRPLYPA